MDISYSMDASNTLTWYNAGEECSVDDDDIDLHSAETITTIEAPLSAKNKCIRGFKWLGTKMSGAVRDARTVYSNLQQKQEIFALIAERNVRLHQLAESKKQLELSADELSKDDLNAFLQTLFDEETQLIKEISALNRQIDCLPVVEGVAGSTVTVLKVVSLSASVLRMIANTLVAAGQSVAAFTQVSAIASCVVVPISALMTLLGVATTSENIHAVRKDKAVMRQYSRQRLAVYREHLASLAKPDNDDKAQQTLAIATASADCLEHFLVPALRERVVTKAISVAIKAVFDATMVGSTVLGMMGFVGSFIGGFGAGLLPIAGGLAVGGAIGQIAGPWIVERLRAFHCRSSHIDSKTLEARVKERIREELDAWDSLSEAGLTEMTATTMMFRILKRYYDVMPHGWGAREWAESLLADTDGLETKRFQQAIQSLLHYDTTGFLHRAVIWPIRRLTRRLANRRSSSSTLSVPQSLEIG